MKPFHDYELSEILAERKEKAFREIDQMPNEEIMANDLSILAENIYQEYFIEPVTIYEEIFSKRNTRQKKIQVYIDPFFRDDPNQEYVEIDGIITTFYYSYTGDAQLFKCRASSFSLGPYPDISIQDTTISVSIECSLDEMRKPNAKDRLISDLEHRVNDIKNGLSYANADAGSFNNFLKRQAMKWLEEKKRKVEDYYQIAAMLEIPVKKTDYAMTHIPLKRKIIPTSKKYDHSNYYGIQDNDYKDILSTIKHAGSTFERTPASYKSLHEEELRDIILAQLNGIYKGDATGETFRNTGKTDICIERENRAAFIGECKIWTGKQTIAEAIDQLDHYLTWRDCKTALIYFVRRKDFLGILETTKTALQSIDGIKDVSELDKNEFSCTFFSKSNPGQLVEMRLMLFNLFCSK